MSWWDYGYQITAMANRTILVDNNTWNNTHISRVGQVKYISSRREKLMIEREIFVIFRLCHQQKIKPMRSCENWMLIMYWLSSEV